MYFRYYCYYTHALKCFWRKPEQWRGEMEYCRCCKFEARREEPVQHLSVVHFLRWYVQKMATKCEGFKRGAPSASVSFALNSESSHIRKEHSFAKQTILQIYTYIFLRYVKGPLTESMMSIQVSQVFRKDQLQRGKKKNPPPPNSCRWIRFAK